MKMTPDIPHVSVGMMLDGLGSEDRDTREAAAFLLARSLAAGLKLQGYGPEQFAPLAAGLSALLERCIDGDGDALEQLASAIDPSSPLGGEHAHEWN